MEDFLHIAMAEHQQDVTITLFLSLLYAFLFFILLSSFLNIYNCVSINLYGLYLVLFLGNIGGDSPPPDPLTETGRSEYEDEEEEETNENYSNSSPINAKQSRVCFSFFFFFCLLNAFVIIFKIINEGRTNKEPRGRKLE